MFISQSLILRLTLTKANCHLNVLSLFLLTRTWFLVPLATDPPCPQIGVVDSNTILDSSFSASSTYSNEYKPHFARLMGLSRGWKLTTADRDSKNSFLQIDLGAVFSIYAVATQGENGHGFDEWTKSCKLQLSLNGNTVSHYKENKAEKVILSLLTFFVLF